MESIEKHIEKEKEILDNHMISPNQILHKTPRMYHHMSNYHDTHNKL